LVVPITACLYDEAGTGPCNIQKKRFRNQVRFVDKEVYVGENAGNSKELPKKLQAFKLQAFLCAVIVSDHTSHLNILLRFTAGEVADKTGR